MPFSLEMRRASSNPDVPQHHMTSKLSLYFAAGLASIGFMSALQAESVLSWGRQVLPPPEEISTLMDVAAGNDFNVAIRPGGTVVAWGSNNFRQSTVPEDLRDVTAVAAGGHHALALRRDGTVVAWGNNRDEQANVPEGLRDVIAISAGERHSLALRNDGSVVAWGANDHGQILVPEDLAEVAAIAAGSYHNLALRSDGSVVAWGSNLEDQAAVPEDLTEATAVAAGGSHSLALLRDGTVAAWGNNSFGQSNGPDARGRIIRIDAGRDHNLALLDSGEVTTWGRNHYGQTDLPDRTAPAGRIAAGAYHNVVLTEDGSVTAWGNNDSGQSLNPEDLEEIISIAAWENHTIALKSDGTVISWGTTISAGIEPDAERLRDIVAIAAGRAHGLALRGDGTVVGWGDNFYRQAAPPQNLHRVVAIDAGEFHSLALRNDGTVVAWGNNFQGQLNVPEEATQVMAIAAGQSHSLALRADGRVVAWGHNFFGQSSVPEDLDQVVAIAAGSYHSLALRRDGTVEAWGSNLFGQTDVPAGLSDAVQISASSSHSAAIRQNRTLVAWGSNFYNQSTPPENLRQIADMDIGAARTVVVIGDLQPPRLLSPLPSGTIAAGESVALVPFVRGSDPMIFQWVKDGRTIPGATNRALDLDSVDARASGSYSVIIANPVGNTSSASASIEVNDPAVWVEARPRVAVLGETARFVAHAAGTEPLSFRWFKDGEPIGEAESDTLVIEQVREEDTGTYAVEASNEFGTALSNQIQFFVAPQILRQPPEVATARIGERVTLSIEASGSPPLQVQWMRDGVPLEGANDPSLTLEDVSVEDGGVYTAHVLNPAGRVVSEPVVLQIAPHIVLQPEVQVFSQFGGTAVFEVRAIGTPPLTYHWMRDGELIQETEEPRMVLEQVQADDAGQYHVVVFNEAGRVESEPARLIVPPAITQHPKSTIVRAGEEAVLTVEAVGSVPIEYQWFKNDEPLPGENGPQLRLDQIDGSDSGRYSVTVSNEVGSSTSEAAIIAVAPSIVAGPQPVSASAGDQVILEVQAAGSHPLHFQWVKDGNVISNATGPTLTLESLTPEDAGNYSVVVSNSAGIAVSDPASVDVQPGGSHYGTPPER